MSESTAGGRPGIVELGRICDEQRATSLGWFAAVGGWVADEPDPELQRLYATASHRHAWHADLWHDRRPAIPPVDARREPGPVVIETEGDRSATYREGLTAMRRALRSLREVIDPDLDPSTIRVVELVDADLADLAERIDGLDVRPPLSPER